MPCRTDVFLNSNSWLEMPTLSTDPVTLGEPRHLQSSCPVGLGLGFPTAGEADVFQAERKSNESDWPPRDMSRKSDAEHDNSACRRVPKRAAALQVCLSHWHGHLVLLRSNCMGPYEGSWWKLWQGGLAGQRAGLGFAGSATIAYSETSVQQSSWHDLTILHEGRAEVRGRLSSGLEEPCHN